MNARQKSALVLLLSMAGIAPGAWAKCDVRSVSSTTWSAYCPASEPKTYYRISIACKQLSTGRGGGGIGKWELQGNKLRRSYATCLPGFVPQTYKITHSY